MAYWGLTHCNLSWMGQQQLNSSCLCSKFGTSFICRKYLETFTWVKVKIMYWTITLVKLKVAHTNSAWVSDINSILVSKVRVRENHIYIYIYVYSVEIGPLYGGMSVFQIMRSASGVLLIFGASVLGFFLFLCFFIRLQYSFKNVLPWLWSSVQSTTKLVTKVKVNSWS